MDHIKIAGEIFPGPNDFTMLTEPIIANEITTMPGNIIGDIVGIKFSDTTLNWDTLKDEELKRLLDVTNPLKGIFAFNFYDPEGAENTRAIWALRIGRVITKTQFKDEQGNIVWKGIALTLRFPYAIT